MIFPYFHKPQHSLKGGTYEKTKIYIILLDFCVFTLPASAQLFKNKKARR